MTAVPFPPRSSGQASPGRETPAPWTVERLTDGFLFFVLFVFSLFYLYHAARLVEYPYSIDYGEGYLLNQGNEIAHFRSPYQPIDEPPWLVANYPPVYPTAVAVGIRIFGLQFHFGRALSVLGILTGAFCLYRIVVYQTLHRFSGWIAALAWLSAYPVYNWGTHHRVDSLAIGFEALGLLFLIGRNRLHVSILFFLLALYTRQTLWMGPLAGYLYLRRTEGPRPAAVWFGKLLLLGGSLFIVLTLLTGGEFARHLVLYNANEYHWKDVWNMFRGAVMATMQFPTLFLLFYLVRSVATGKWDLAAICIPFSILTFLLVGKLGSATNYLYELSFASSWAVALTLAETKALLPERNVFRFFPGLILGVGLLFPLHIPHFYGQWGIWDWGGTPIKESSLITSDLIARLKKIPEPVLCQDAGVALLAGHPLHWQPFIMTQLAHQGRWDPKPLYDKIRNKEYHALVLPIDLDADPNSWKSEEWWTQFNEKLAQIIRKSYRVEPRLRLPPERRRMMDPRFVRGYHSSFGTNYLYLPR